MYPWLRVMYAVVVIGSRIRKSACGMNFSTFWPCASATGDPSVEAKASKAIAAVKKCDREIRLLMARVSEDERASSGTHRSRRCVATF